jgi:porphobilinogen deaminase
VVLSFDGTERLTAAGTGPPESAEQIGRDVARRLIDQGAARLIDAARG